MSERPLTMPFGKHKGKAFTELDTDYLEWGISNLNFREEKYTLAFRAELERRQAGGQQQKPSQQPPQHQQARQSGIPRERIVMAIGLLKQQSDHPAVHASLDSLLRMLDSVEQPSQARTVPTDGAKRTAAVIEEPEEDEHESEQGIPF